MKRIAAGVHLHPLTPNSSPFSLDIWISHYDKKFNSCLYSGRDLVEIGKRNVVARRVLDPRHQLKAKLECNKPRSGRDVRFQIVISET